MSHDAFAGVARTWEETVVIPTYGTGAPEANPMFLEKRVYQGSSGVVYPYPIIDRVESEAQPQAWQAVFLENRYLRIMLLPALGGRVQMAIDKTNDYPFVYYNRVIKPALVGLAGPWISGGIEFNWPQHHRPTTYSPVDTRLQENTDGSVTVWCSEVERMFRMKGMIGFTLYPDAAFLELSVQLYNRSDKPQTFLWWANPAVHVNDDYQSVFPPDVHAVMDHGKRAVSDFPIATGTYYKVNYAPGTDISRYKNIPVPTSYMAYHSDFDFIGCYDHGKGAGMMHVANHHLVPGKKQWTWGNGEFGKAWDRQLTDADGPYIELMCGAFTDNQPDFSWLQPGEEKRFTQVFMPYKAIGGAKNASREAIINLELRDGGAHIGVYVSRDRQVRVDLLADGHILFSQEARLSPEKVMTARVPYAGDAGSLVLRVCDDAGATLVAYRPQTGPMPPVPAPARAAPPPADVPSNDELFLHGLHLEQYRHATYAPEPYYEEALRRDPGDSRCNNALGLLLLRRGKFASAETYFRRAIVRLTLRNPNPYDGEPYYNLGLALKMQSRFDDAYDAFYKAAWNSSWRGVASFELARIDCMRGRLDEALTLLDTALTLNADHHQARHLRIVCLRALGDQAGAAAEIDRALNRDPFNTGALAERRWLSNDPAVAAAPLPVSAYAVRETALDYAHAGCYGEARALLAEAPPDDLMAVYYAAWCAGQQGDAAGCAEALARAAAMNPDFCFPNEVEAVLALTLAIERSPLDGNAPYALGNFWYAHRRYEEAIAAWEQASVRKPDFATPLRNLGIAWMNKRGDGARALAAYSQAFERNARDPRVLLELDQLAKRLGHAPEDRLSGLDAHVELVVQRDDLLLERATLLNLTGQHARALDLLLGHIFHPWEGGEGKVAEQYVMSLMQLGRAALERGQPDEAIALLSRALTYPANLNEGKLSAAGDNHIHYALGLAFEAAGDAAGARRHFERAAAGSLEPASPLYYNDQPPDMIFYQGLARQKLGEPQTARTIFETLVAYGQAHVDDVVQMDYFAVSLPNFLIFEDDLTRRNRIHCHYMMALGYLGLGDAAAAELQFQSVTALEPHHIGTAAHRSMVGAAAR